MNRLQGLYAITDPKLIPENHLVDTVNCAIQGGARIIQYRDKSKDPEKRLQQAEALQRICKQQQVTLIINDDIELALRVDADGVHIGIDDTPLAEARQRMGRHKIIGVSCYNQFELARRAAEQGADYIAFGSFFPSSTKPHAVPAELSLLRKARQQLELPVCAIGGITRENAPPLLNAGANMLAVVSSIFGDVDTLSCCRQFQQLFDKHQGENQGRSE